MFYTNKEDAIKRTIANLLNTYDSESIAKTFKQLTFIGPVDMIKTSESELQSIIEEYNSQGKWAEEYNTTNEDCCIAEWTQSMQYGELTLEDAISELEPEVMEAIESLKAIGMKEEEILTLLGDNSTLEPCNIYTVSNELCRGMLGELEEQPSDELLERFEALSDGDKDTVRNQCDWYINTDGWMYIDCNYDGWVLVLDGDSFLDTVENLKRVG